MTKQDFIKQYAANMKADCDSGKHAYVIPADGWEGLAARMVAGIIAGRANVSDVAKKTAKFFGAKPTVAGVTALLKALPERQSADFMFSHQGSLVMVYPITEAAKEFLTRTAPEDAQFLGDAMAVEPRYLDGVREAIKSEGLTIQ